MVSESALAIGAQLPSSEQIARTISAVSGANSPTARAPPRGPRRRFSTFKHLGLWEIKQRPPPKAAGPPKVPEYSIDYSVSQLSASDNWLYVDPEPAYA